MPEHALRPKDGTYRFKGYLLSSEQWGTLAYSAFVAVCAGILLWTYSDELNAIWPAQIIGGIALAMAVAAFFSWSRARRPVEVIILAGGTAPSLIASPPGAVQTWIFSVDGDVSPATVDPRWWVRRGTGFAPVDADPVAPAPVAPAASMPSMTAAELAAE